MDEKFEVSMQEERRFHRKHSRDSVTGCWIWHGRRAGKYGMFDRKGRPIGAHRYSAMLFNLPRPEGCDLIIHKCGDPACVNPEHLYWGTNKEAMVQMVKQGKNKPAPGESNGNHTLTEQEVHDIRQMYSANPYYGAKVELARQFCVDTMTVCRVLSRETWNHI